MLAKLLIVTGMTLAPVVGLAQSTSHFYLGVAATVQSFTGSNIFGPGLTIGYQLNPRWAIQSEAVLHWHSNAISENYDVGNGNIDQYTYTSRSTSLAVPILARYTFTAPTARLRIDGLFGASWLHSIYRTTGTHTYEPSTVYNYAYNYTSNGIGVGLGPTLRYKIGSYLDLVASSLAQVVLTGGGGSFNDRVFLTTQFGLQYAFGH